MSCVRLLYHVHIYTRKCQKKIFAIFKNIFKYIIYSNNFRIIQFIFFNTETNHFLRLRKKELICPDFLFTLIFLTHKLQYHVLLLRWELVELQLVYVSIQILIVYGNVFFSISFFSAKLKGCKIINQL